MMFLYFISRSFSFCFISSSIFNDKFCWIHSNRCSLFSLLDKFSKTRFFFLLLLIRFMRNVSILLCRFFERLPVTSLNAQDSSGYVSLNLLLASPTWLFSHNVLLRTRRFGSSTDWFRKDILKESRTKLSCV